MGMGVDASYGVGGMGMEYNGMVGGMGMGGIGEEYAFGADVYGFSGFNGNGAVHGWSNDAHTNNTHNNTNHSNANANAEDGVNGKSLSTTPTPQMFSPSPSSTYTHSPYAQNAHAYSGDSYVHSYPEFNDISVGEMNMGGMGGMGMGMGGGMGGMGGMGMFMPDDFDIAAIQSVEFGLPPTPSIDSQPSEDTPSKLHVDAYEHHQVEEYGHVGMNGMDTDMQGAVNV